MTYAPHEQRVIDEKTELDDKAKKLSTFIGENPLFETPTTSVVCGWQRNENAKTLPPEGAK